jgi:hypothetical protein
MSTRERPKLLYGADSTPTPLINGVCPVSSCAPTACVQCKERGSPRGSSFPVYTLVAPLALA